MIDEYGAQRRAFMTTSLHTRVEEAIATGSPCRVCGQMIHHGEKQRRREWGIERAHEACGWWTQAERLGQVPYTILNRPEDAYRIFERTRPGTLYVFFEWCCPACELDAADTRRPDEESELRCIRCCPDKTKLEPGRRVELVSAMWFRRGGRQKVTIRSGEVIGKVRRLEGANVVIDTKTMGLVTLQTSQVRVRP